MTKLKICFILKQLQGCLKFNLKLHNLIFHLLVNTVLTSGASDMDYRSLFLLRKIDDSETARLIYFRYLQFVIYLIHNWIHFKFISKLLFNLQNKPTRKSNELYMGLSWKKLINVNLLEPNQFTNISNNFIFLIYVEIFYIFLFSMNPAWDGVSMRKKIVFLPKGLFTLWTFEKTRFIMHCAHIITNMTRLRKADCTQVTLKRSWQSSSVPLLVSTKICGGGKWRITFRTQKPSW